MFTYSEMLLFLFRCFVRLTFFSRRPTGEPVGVVRPQPTEGILSPNLASNTTGADQDDDETSPGAQSPRYGDFREEQNIWGR
jgi:hypothetical protein